MKLYGPIKRPGIQCHCLYCNFFGLIWSGTYLGPLPCPQCLCKDGFIKV